MEEILNKLVYAEPQNLAAKVVLADVFEQIGYQRENLSGQNDITSIVSCTSRLPLMAESVEKLGV